MSDIIVAPFSNSDIRDWPPGHFSEMMHLLVAERENTMIRVIGTVSQRLRASEIVRPLSAERVSNDCGRLSWAEVLHLVRDAACVIGNNSGIAHLAAFYGVPTVCIFGGSHQRLEWRPSGRRTVLVSRAIGCSPCHLDHGAACRYDKACLRQIAPVEVIAAATLAMAMGDAVPTGEGNVFS